jgi:hypothetical protein
VQPTAIVENIWDSYNVFKKLNINEQTTNSSADLAVDLADTAGYLTTLLEE